MVRRRTGDPKICCIYALLDPVDRDIRYIGQSIDVMHRWEMHLWESVHYRKTPVQKWIAKLIANDAEPILQILEEMDADRLDDAEQAWVMIAREYQGDRLLNVLDGGGQFALRSYHKGRPKSAEWRAKVSESQRGIPRPSSQRPKSAETRARMSASAKINSNRPEERERRSNHMKELWQNPAYREQQTAALRKRGGAKT